ncbi:hypothetical protein A2160_01125 [Candidatus Beckwithbacteria bacterium RBG_13_42_9]|uniref:Uncharacterized protein n=1 Tax=Candidatus Beckwithbacteria bacterium RBG_13_42_9 TaxID=1797457 RepID=A0A1F5E3E6_9BACT|nr:MAG: hypothetical protein A2160_01125 [Candidatus Beckwithbacteria bacterium RBG_13_42_9]
MLLRDLDFCFHHHSELTVDGDNWWFEGETHALEGAGTGGANFQIWVHVHSSSPSLSVAEKLLKKILRPFYSQRSLWLNPVTLLLASKNQIKMDF